MSIAGNLKTMQLAELLQWLSLSKKNGTLVIDDGRVTKQIFFRAGRIISSASTDPKEQLGHFLVSHGLISEHDLAKAMALQEETRTLLGKILVTLGAIQEEVLQRLLRRKAEESLFDLFTWEEGDFRFLDDELPTSMMIPLDLEITGIVLEGVRRLDEWKRIREYIPTMQAIPVSLTPLDDPERPQGVRQVLALVDDDRSIEEICIQTHSSEFFVCRVLFEQIQLKRLKVVKPRWPVSEEGRLPGISSTIGASALLATGRRHLEQGRYEHAVRHFRAARSLEPENREIEGEVEMIEREIRGKLEAGGVRMTAVPKLTKELAELTSSKISPQEGFMLTRIDGLYDLQSLVKITPMPALDALLVFWRLLKAGHVKLEEDGG